MATGDERGAVPVEVAYALPRRQVLIPLHVPPGTTIEQAIRLSGILDEFPEIDLSACRMGVFGQLCSPGRMLEAGDRVEIYRPLLADPKEVRRRLAAQGQSMGRARSKGQD